MANKIKIAAKASEDIKNTWSEIAEFNPVFADKLRAEFLGKFNLIAENPNIGCRHDKVVFNARSFPYKKYFIFFFESEDGIEIYRVLHGVRNIKVLVEDYVEGLKP